MPKHPESTWSTNGAARGNLFVDADPDLHEFGSATAPTARPVTPRRARGLVVPIEELPTAWPAQDAARFARRRPGTLGATKRLLELAAGADLAATRLVMRLLARPYGALVVLGATLALLLVVTWLGVSLLSTTAERDHARREQRATAATLEAAGAQIRVLTAQRDRAIGAASAARRHQATAAHAARTWRTRAATAKRQLAHGRRTNRRARSHR
jgi:hypothetical protein